MDKPLSLVEAKELFEQANLLLKAHKVKRAGAVLDQIEAGGRGDHPGLAMFRVRLARLTENNVDLMRYASVAYLIDSDRAGSYLNYALALRNLGRGDDADAVLQKAAKANPEAVEPVLCLANWAEERGQIENALSQFRAVLARMPDHKKALQRQVALALDLKRFAEAKAALTQFDRQFPHAVEAARLRLALYRAQGEWQAAVEPSRRAFELSGQQRDGIAYVDILSKAGRSELALDLLKQEVFADAKLDWLAVRKAGLLERVGQSEAALDEIKNFLVDRPDHFPALALYSRVLGSLGRQNEAEPILHKLAAKAPIGIASPAALQLAEWLHTSQRTERAIEVLQNARQRDGRNGMLLTLAANLFCDLDRRNAAALIAKNFSEIPVRNIGEVLARARVLARLKDADGEYAVLSEAISVYGLDWKVLTYVVQRATPFMPLFEIEECLKSLEVNCGVCFSDQTWIQLYLAHSDYLRAEIYLKAHPRGRRSEGQARDILRLLIARNRSVVARRYLRFCRRAWPNSASFIVLELDILIQLGRLDEAERALKATPKGDAKLTKRLFEIEILLQLYRSPGVWPQGVGRSRDALVELSPLVLQRLLRNTIAEADLNVADELCELYVAQKDERGRQNWRTTLEGQVLTEMRLLATEFGTDWPGAGLWEHDTRLARETRNKPWSTVLAAAHIRRAVGTEPLMEVAAKPRSAGVIPKQIWQYWDDPPPPEAVSELVASWSQLCGWSHQLYNRFLARDFLTKEFSPEWCRAFRLARGPAEEADFLRLCLLVRWGGVWADADDRLHGDLSSLLQGDAGLVVFREPIGGGIANNFIAAAPGHPAIKQAAKWVVEALLQRANETVWLQSGPGLLTRAVGQFLATKGASSKRGGIKICGQDILRREVGIHNRLPYKHSIRYWNRKRLRDPGYATLLKRLVTDVSAE